MTGTTTKSLRPPFGIAKVACALAPTPSSTWSSISGAENVMFLKEHMASNPTASCSPYLLDAAKTWRALRVAKIKALRGKYRPALTPSDAFANLAGACG